MWYNNNNKFKCGEVTSGLTISTVCIRSGKFHLFVMENSYCTIQKILVYLGTGYLLVCWDGQTLFFDQFLVVIPF